jgi:hypothetical protein
MYSELFENSPDTIGILTSKLCCVFSWMTVNCSALESGSCPYQRRADVLGPLPRQSADYTLHPKSLPLKLVCARSPTDIAEAWSWILWTDQRTIIGELCQWVSCPNSLTRFLLSFVIRSRHWLPTETKLCGLYQSLRGMRYSKRERCTRTCPPVWLINFPFESAKCLGTSRNRELFSPPASSVMGAYVSFTVDKMVGAISWQLFSLHRVHAASSFMKSGVSWLA